MFEPSPGGDPLSVPVELSTVPLHAAAKHHNRVPALIESMIYEQRRRPIRER